MQFKQIDQWDILRIAADLCDLPPGMSTLFKPDKDGGLSITFLKEVCSIVLRVGNIIIWTHRTYGAHCFDSFKLISCHYTSFRK